MSIYSHACDGSLHPLFHHMRLLNSITDQDFTDVIAISCSRSMQRNDKGELLESMALRGDVEISSLQKAAHTVESIEARMVRNSCTSERMEKELASLGLQSEKTRILKEFIISQSKTSSDSAENFPRTVAIPAGQLVDMEWKFGVTAASSELDKLGTTFVQLKLKVSKPDGNLESLNMELSLSQFYNLLHQLEKAKSSLEYMSM